MKKQEMNGQDIPDFASAYKFAIIHLLWAICEGQRHLIFGMVELYPSDFDIEDAPKLDEQGSKPFPYNKKSYRLYYVRHKEDNVDEAIRWYRKIKEEEHVELYWDKPDKNGNLKKIPCGQMVDIRTWPLFELAKKAHENPQSPTNNEENKEDEGLPFIAKVWGVVRTHHLYPAFYKDQELYGFLSCKREALDWMQTYLMWDISFYEDLIGSVHLVMPNPLYGSRIIRVIPLKQEAGSSNKPREDQRIPSERTDADRLRITFTPRKGTSLENLSICYFEKTNTGITIGRSSRVKNNFCEIPLIGKEDSFSFYFKDSGYGFIDYTSRAPFILGFRLDLNVATRKKIIHVNDNVNTVTEYESIKFGGENGDHGNTRMIPLQEKVTDVILKHKKYYEGQKYGQKIFQDHEEAKLCIKEIIHSAKNKLTFIDPYMAIIDFFEYALEGTRRNLEVTLLTGKDDFKKNQTPEILERVKNIAERENIKILGMTGKPKIHDRFIIVDDDIWMLGGSLNFIGKRLSVMLKTPDPKSLGECLEKIIHSDDVKDFKEWFEETSVREKPMENKTLIDKICLFIKKFWRKK